MDQSELLLQPYQLNDRIQLNNRIVMAPMTRTMANDDLSPTPQMAAYYAKRADAGLIVTEGTIISPDGLGYPNVPGIYTQKQIDGWRQVTEAVHQQDGKIFLQIWHVGRVSHPVFLEGNLPVSASATLMSGKVRRANDLYYGFSRAASIDDIQTLIKSYGKASKNAIEAGFDGIEIHGANGYLIDQFLHYHTNHRTDQYGLKPKNLARFALEVVSACIGEIGSDRVGLRVSPGGYLNEIIGDTRDAAVFQYVFEQLEECKIAYIHTGNYDDSVQFKELKNLKMSEFIRQHYKGKLIGNGGYTLEQAAAAIENNAFDLIAVGRPFIANPDLINRFKTKKTLEPYKAEMLNVLI